MDITAQIYEYSCVSDLSYKEDRFYLSCSCVKPHCIKIEADSSGTIADVPLEQEENVWNLENFGVDHRTFFKRNEI